MLSKIETDFSIVTAILGLVPTVSITFTHGKQGYISGIGYSDSYMYFMNNDLYQTWIKLINSKQTKQQFHSMLSTHLYNITSEVENMPPEYKGNTYFEDAEGCLHPMAVNLSQASFKEKLTKKPSHGEFLSIFTGWERHAIGINFITERMENSKFVIHMIVVNRGTSSSETKKDEDDFLSKTVQCYKFNYPISDTVLDQIYGACSGREANNSTLKKKLSNLFFPKENKDGVRFTFDQLFHSPELIDARNFKLSDRMLKSRQKAGNCAIANLNPSMHYNLATEIMRNTNKGFIECYGETGEAYKQLRVTIREHAFKKLLEMRNNIKNQDAWFHLIIQALGKYGSKQETKREEGSENIFRMIEACYPSQYADIAAVINRYNFGEIKREIDEFHANILKIQEEIKNIDNTIKNTKPQDLKKFQKQREQYEAEIKKFERYVKLHQHPIQAKKEHERYLQSKEHLTQVSRESKEPLVDEPITKTKEIVSPDLDLVEASTPVIMHTTTNNPSPFFQQNSNSTDKSSPQQGREQTLANK